jgi:hypothetical protein
MTKIYTILFSLLIVGAGCKTATKAYDKGDYTNAIELSLKKLQKDPSDGETKALLQNAYRFAVTKSEEKIRTLSNSSTESRYEQIYNEYRSLQNLYQQLKQYPSLTGHVKAMDYSDYLITYQKKAADVHYQKGLMFMSQGDKRSFQKAYQSFGAAQRISRDDTAIAKRMRESYDLAIVRVVVLPMQDGYNNGYGAYGGGYQYSNSYQMRNFSDEVVRNLQFGSSNEFVKFYSEWDTRGKDIEADEVLEMRFGRMEIGRPYDQTQTRNVSKEVVVKEIVYKPDSVVKQYQRVTAQLTVTRRTMSSIGDLYVTSRDMQGRILWNDIFRGEHRWQTEFATYRGDERALSSSDRALLNRYDTNEPREEEVLEQVLRQIQSDMSYRMRSHFNRY